jgi:glycosyltransferase involved in cell wall biosynthesis
MKIKVANIIEDGRIAGPQLRMLAVSYRLKLFQISTTIIHPKEDAEVFVDEIIAHNIPHIPVNINRLSKNYLGFINYMIHFPLRIYSLFKVFKKNKFDVIHCSGGSWQVLGLIAARFSGIPAIWHLNDTIMPNWARPLFNIICNQFASGVIVAGERVRHHYLGDSIINIPIHVIQAPVDCIRFSSDRVSSHEKILNYTGLKIVTVANINPLKGIEYFIEMAEILSNKYDNLSFIIVGPVYQSQSNYFNKLIKIIDDKKLVNIHFFGGCKDIERVLKGADIYVCSSISEASPTSVWEAMAMSRPIISTDVGDVSRFIINNRSGFIVPIKDSAKLANAASLLIDNSEMRANFGTEARAVALANLDIDACVKAHKKIYQEVIKHYQLHSPPTQIL